MKENIDISKERFEQIEAYLLNKMTEADRNSFEKELGSDKQLKKEVEIQHEIMLAVQSGELRKRLNIFHGNILKQTGSSRWYLVAASVVVLLAVGLWLMTKPDKFEKVLADNITIDPGLPVPMSAVDDYIFYDAMVDYKAGKYDLALSKWQSVFAANPESDTLSFYIGVASFNLEKFEQAIPYFEKVIDQNSPVFYDKAEWYLALSLVATKNSNQLKKLAQESNSIYKEKIVAMASKLE